MFHQGSLQLMFRYSQLIVRITAMVLSILIGTFSLDIQHASTLNTTSHYHSKHTKMIENWGPRLERRHEPGPGFRYSKPDFSAHEKAVKEAGYPWVCSNPLKPSWISLEDNPRPNGFPDRLNIHGHHGVNTHLIVSGDLTVRKIKQFHGQVSVPVLTISTDPGAPREAATVGDEMYWGTTERGCVFVEGHRCLSPATANRFMDRGTLRWVDRQGYEVNKYEQDYIKGQLQGARFDWDSARRRASIRFAEHNGTTENLAKWFKKEWEADQSANGPLLPVCHPLDDQVGGTTDDEDEDEDKHEGFNWSSVYPWWLMTLASGCADLMARKGPGRLRLVVWLSIVVLPIILGLAVKMGWLGSV